jgi:hypothetical protein
MLFSRQQERIGMNKDDYSYSLYSLRPDYGATPKFYHDSKLPATGFSSLYKVDFATAQAIDKAGTCKGFKGVVYSERLWLDIDGYEKADKVEEKLNVFGLAYISFDTGGRGAHFGISRSNVPSHVLPLQDKQWVQEHFPEADTSIYTHLHPFRLAGTEHSRTGRKKLQVGATVGKSLILPPFSNESPKTGSNSEAFSRTPSEASIFDNFFIQRNTQEVPQEGQRHAQLVRLIYALRDAGYDVNIAKWWVSEVNKRFLPPKEEHEIEKTVQSIYR